MIDTFNITLKNSLSFMAFHLTTIQFEGKKNHNHQIHQFRKDFKNLVKFFFEKFFIEINDEVKKITFN